MPASSSVGFFGKLPSNGDFLQRRVAQPFLDIWDPWLQECVHASKQSLQESWLSIYLTSPVWRFVLTDATCGSGAYAGILVPSVDRVGRYFPMTLVTQIDVDANPLQFATRFAAWFDALEALVVSALEASDLDLEWFDGQVMESVQHLQDEFDPAERSLQQLFAHAGFPGGAQYWRAPLMSAAGLQDAVNAFAFGGLSAQLRPLSLWWTEGSAASSPSWLSARGLPAPDRFAALLDGQWQRHGWNDLGELPAEGMRVAPQAGHPDELSALLNSAPPVAAPPVVAPTDAAPLAVARSTVPEVQLSAIESNRAAFVQRPEIGLWAVAATDAGADPAGVRMLADALQQLAPAASLSALVESVRLTLGEVHGNLTRLAARDVMRVEAQASAVVLASSGVECAFLSAGPVQKFLVRARGLYAVDEPGEPEARTDPGSLMDLLSDASDSRALGTKRFEGMQVHYERLNREDQWILCAQPLIGAAAHSRLAATAASGMPINAGTVIDAVSASNFGQAVLPIMTVEI